LQPAEVQTNVATTNDTPNAPVGDQLTDLPNNIGSSLKAGVVMKEQEPKKKMMDVIK